MHSLNCHVCNRIAFKQGSILIKQQQWWLRICTITSYVIFKLLLPICTSNFFQKILKKNALSRIWEHHYSIVLYTVNVRQKNVTELDSRRRKTNLDSGKETTADCPNSFHKSKLSLRYNHLSILSFLEPFAPLCPENSEGAFFFLDASSALIEEQEPSYECLSCEEAPE